MNKQLKDLLDSVIIYKCNLDGTFIKEDISNCYDDVYEVTGEETKLSELIFQSIVFYSFNEKDIDICNFTQQQLLALERKLKYDVDANESTKLKYGFYGEILLDIILHRFYKTSKIISRGFFYNPLDDNEAKGYDSYHLIEKEDSIELWLGESKFRKKYHSSIKEILSSFDRVFSDNYLNKNFIAILDNYQNLNIESGALYNLLNEWKDSFGFKLSDYVDKYNMILYYPMFIAYNSQKDVDKGIKTMTNYINSVFKSKGIDLSDSKWNRFFIFLPLKNLDDVRKGVIEWIESIV